VGTEYRSIVLYTTEAQKTDTEKFIAEIEASHTEGGHITTEVKPLDVFYPAEEYHRDYFARNPEKAYCQLVINQKLEKIQKKFAQLLNANESI
jgi:peptide-methionine (S)-S-oxide reductase